jgi:hypothetical protein
MDQGSQFTGAASTGVLIKNGIAINMDDEGCECRESDPAVLIVQPVQDRLAENAANLLDRAP